MANLTSLTIGRWSGTGLPDSDEMIKNFLNKHLTTPLPSVTALKVLIYKDRDTIGVILSQSKILFPNLKQLAVDVHKMYLKRSFRSVYSLVKKSGWNIKVVEINRGEGKTLFMMLDEEDSHIDMRFEGSAENLESSDEDDRESSGEEWEVNRENFND
jgi:hypothetical protein